MTDPTLITVAHSHTTRPVRTRVSSIPLGVGAATTFLALVTLCALWPGLLTPHDPYAVNLGATLAPPGGPHPFGTDQSGRDLLSRVIAGTGDSLLIGIAATTLALLIGTLIGTAAALAPRHVRWLIDRFIDAMLAFPSVILAFLLIAASGPGVLTLTIAIGIGTAPGYARVIRAQVTSVAVADYIEAARSVYSSSWTVMRKSLLPNALRPLVAMFALGIGQSIVWAAGLSFLGFGVAPPAAEWGALLNSGRELVTQAWWLEVFPGAVIVAVSLSCTVVGRYLQDVLEHRVGRTR
ncbi:MAG: ABC transporter permease [Gordonia sp. (in: high G+C Gram-positive bacteria)]